jgi:mRNA turnover protein 4
MPKSKRDKVVHLTKTDKKGTVLKERLINDVREQVDEYARAFIFDVENMRNTKLKEVRDDWRTSRMFLGKNKVIQIALGRTPEDEHRPGLAKFARALTGTRGVLFTNSSLKDAQKYFAALSASAHARSGFVAEFDFKLEKGFLEGQPFSMEPSLRKLGMPVRLNDGRVELLTECVVCKKGDVLTPEQCNLLKIFGVEMATFRMQLICQWSNDGKVTDLMKKQKK